MGECNIYVAKMVQRSIFHSIHFGIHGCLLMAIQLHYMAVVTDVVLIETDVGLVEL